MELSAIEAYALRQRNRVFTESLCCNEVFSKKIGFWAIRASVAVGWVEERTLRFTPPNKEFPIAPKLLLTSSPFLPLVLEPATELTPFFR
jgi:hypothetical protein